MVKAVIFDMDGTMVDTETIHSEAFSNVLRIYGANPKPHKHGVVHLVGVNTEDILRFLIKKYHITGNIQIMSTQVREEYFRLVQKGNIKPMKGLKKLINVLKKKKIKLAVASGSSSKNLNVMLTKLGIQKKFDVVIGADQVKLGKPHPEIYETTVKKLGIKKDDGVVIEDTESGIQAAKSAGLKVIAVPNKFTKDHNFSKADTIIKSLNDITLPLLHSL